MNIFEIFLLLFFLWSIILRLRNDAPNKVKISSDFLSKEEVIYKVEKIDKQYYLWNKETDDFLVQGPTLEKAVELLIERFPDKTFKEDDDESQRG